MSARLEESPFPRGERNDVLLYSEPQPDAISLIDLAVVLYRRRRLIVAVTTLIFLAGLAFALVKAPTYRYTTPLILAATLDTHKNGSAIRLVESPKDVATRLSAAIITMARRDIAKGEGLELNDVPLADVKAVKDEEQLLLASKVPEEKIDLVRLVHQRVLELLQNSQDALISTVRDQYLARINRAELKLAELSDPAIFAAQQAEMQRTVEKTQLALLSLTDSQRVEEKNLETKLLDADLKRASLSDEEKLVSERLEMQKEAEQLLRREIGEIRNALDAVETRQEQAERQSSDGADALGVMLVRSQLLQYWQRQSNLEERLTITLPAETRSMEKELADLGRERASVKAAMSELESQLAKVRADYKRKAQSLSSELNQNKRDYEKFLTSYERERLEQEQRVAELKAELTQIHPASAVEIAVQSEKPVGPRKLIIILICLILGLMIAVFAAFFAEFLSKTKAQMESDQ